MENQCKNDDIDKDIFNYLTAFKDAWTHDITKDIMIKMNPMYELYAPRNVSTCRQCACVPTNNIGQSVYTVDLPMYDHVVANKN